MDDARVLLVEELDAIGAAPADARARVTALRDAGLSASLAVVDAAGAPGTTGWSDRPADDEHHFGAEADGRAALKRWIASRRPDVVLWCSAHADAGSRSAAGDADVRWWPTGVPAVTAGTPSLLRHVPAPAGGVHDPFDWTPVDLSRLQRPRLSLWDGPYVVAPMPLQGEAGELALRAFARAVSGRDAFDLVVLSALQPGFEALAHRLGVGLRVHFVGPSPREAELAWLQNATAAVWAGTQPLSCGQPLRAFALGCPVLVADGASSALARWCDRRGIAWSVPTGQSGLAERLEQVMDAEPDVRLARERGRTLVRDQDVPLVGRRLAGVLARTPAADDRRAA